jgi:hypothetical protein
LCWKPRKSKFRVWYCEQGGAHKDLKERWDGMKAVVEIKRIEQQTIVVNCYTCSKLYHTPKPFEEAKKGEDG